MKKVVWLNPIVKNIYDFAALKEILQNKGFSVASGLGKIYGVKISSSQTTCQMVKIARIKMLFLKISLTAHLRCDSRFRSIKAR